MTERRKHPRVALRCPVSLYWGEGGAVIHTTTEDLSSNGFYCISDQPVPPARRFRGILEIPMESWRHSGSLLRLDCEVSVEWIEALSGGTRYGIGCAIREYSVLEAGAELGSSSDRRRQEEYEGVGQSPTYPAYEPPTGGE